MAWNEEINDMGLILSLRHLNNGYAKKEKKKLQC